MKRTFTVTAVFSTEEDLSSSNIMDRIRREFNRDIDNIKVESIKVVNEIAYVDEETAALLGDSNIINALNNLKPLTEEQIKKLVAKFNSPEFEEEGRILREQLERENAEAKRIHPDVANELMG